LRAYPGPRALYQTPPPDLLYPLLVARPL